MVDVGVIHGRFQILHLKHMEYLLAAKMRCKKLYVGISNPDDSYIKESENDKKRSKKTANPLTYYERMEMIQAALLDFGVKREEFDIIPFPINRPEYILQYAPKDATFFMSICDKWGEEKKKILEDLGVKVEVLWNRPEEEKGTTATEVRSKIVCNLPWSHLVPRTTYEYVVTHGLDERIKCLAEEEMLEEKEQQEKERRENTLQEKEEEANV
ncbi:nicotinate-nucleotide adenylyltransferase [Faecalicatena sp. Marseille-Q4148]|nr:nicotinate-nucleotide adenylyltransferase [Faecalicatena sp. Marseille-Q4148]